MPDHHQTQSSRWVRGTLLGAALLVLGGAAVGVEVKMLELPTRPGVVQRAALWVPERPRVAFLLFAGGNGGVTLAANGEPRSFKGNFLIRSRNLFVELGAAVAVVAVPSNLGPPDYMSDEFRRSADHASDIRALVAAVRQHVLAPVWLVGTSRGTLSAASLGLALGRELDGVVLTATLSSIADLPVDRFEVPVLLIHHSRDACRMTDYRDMGRLRGHLKAPRTEFIAVSGGRSTGPACEAMSHRGFYGIEAEVVQAIVRWALDLPVMTPMRENPPVHVAK